MLCTICQYHADKKITTTRKPTTTTTRRPTTTPVSDTLRALQYLRDWNITEFKKIRGKTNNTARNTFFIPTFGGTLVSFLVLLCHFLLFLTFFSSLQHLARSRLTCFLPRSRQFSGETAWFGEQVNVSYPNARTCLAVDLFRCLSKLHQRSTKRLPEYVPFVLYFTESLFFVWIRFCVCI